MAGFLQDPAPFGWVPAAPSRAGGTIGIPS